MLFLLLSTILILQVNGKSPDGTDCTRHIECKSHCCLPDLYANGTVKHYDDHGFPIRVCTEESGDGWGDCDILNRETRDFYIIVCIGVMFLGLLAVACHNYITKTREIKKLKYKLKRAEKRI